MYILFNYFYRYTMVSIKIKQGHFFNRMKTALLITSKTAKVILNSVSAKEMYLNIIYLHYGVPRIH